MSLRVLIGVVVGMIPVFVLGQAFDSTPQTRLERIKVETGFTPENPGNVWEISPDAEHHKAIVRVQAGRQGGSGTAITIDGPGMLVVTNHHVIEGYKVAKISSDYGKTGWLPVVWSSPDDDIAVLYSERGKWHYTMPVADESPPVGSQIEMAGYGGPTKKLRHFFAKRLPSNWNAMAISAPTVSGDSGCPMIHEGAVVGVNFGSTGGRTLGDIQDDGGPWRLNYPACSRVGGSKLVEILTQVCRPLGCRPIVRRRGPIALQPPSNHPQEPSPPASEPPGDSPDPCDTCRPGPPGPPGPAGADGRDAEVTPEQLGAIAAAITEQLKKDPSIRGPQGERGPAGPAGTQQDLRFVLVDGSTGRVIDDETYQPGEPIVLDVQNITRSASRQ